VTRSYWQRNGVAANVTSTSEPAFYNILNALDQYWIAFAVNGNPSNTSGLSFTFGVNASLATWQAYNPSQDNFMQIGVEDTVDDGRIFMSNGYCM
jgi:hypothetical protein